MTTIEEDINSSPSFVIFARRSVLIEIRERERDYVRKTTKLIDGNKWRLRLIIEKNVSLNQYVSEQKEKHGIIFIMIIIIIVGAVVVVVVVVLVLVFVV